MMKNWVGLYGVKCVENVQKNSHKNALNLLKMGKIAQ